MAQLAIGEHTIYLCTSDNISKQWWMLKKTSEKVWMESVCVFSTALCTSLPHALAPHSLHDLVPHAGMHQLPYGYQKWAPNRGWLSGWVINLWSGHWENTKMPTVLCWLFHETHQFVLWVFERTRRNCTCFNSSPHTPPKTRMASSLIFQLPKNQNQGFVINKIKYPSHKIGMHRLDPLEQPKLNCNLKPSQSFQFRGLRLGKLGKFIFKKV